VVCTGDVIRPEHLVVGPATPGDPGDLPTLAELERAHVERVLQATGGRKGRSARILGISRPRLNRLIEKYGIGHG
jgi:DNA-binding NtrC family response regulator